MVFASILFLTLYLPVVLTAYHVLFLPVTLGVRPQVFRRLCNLLLLAVSLLFYFWGEKFLVWIVIASTGIDYAAGLLISGGLWQRRIPRLKRGGHRRPLQKLGLILSICSNLAFLGYFKYFNFAVGNYNAAAEAFGLSAAAWKSFATIHLPLGISFYTFQSMSYTIDVYRGHVRATRNFIDFACYVTMFPQLVAGPIVRYRDIATQLVKRTVSRAAFVEGISRFILGLAKKVLVANTVAVLADTVFGLANRDLTTPLAWLGAMAYSLQIYFDFSAYSDMAIGMGQMLGFRFPENFNYPYVARSMRGFWQRWHISLSTWFRDYLYIPLGGSRHAAHRTYMNLVVVFLLCGFWHGASWTFVVWGLYHGAFLVLERVGLGDLIAPRRVLSHIYTVAVFVGGWVLFRADTFGQAMAMFKAMAGFAEGNGVVHSVARYVHTDTVIALVAGVVLSAPVVPLITRRWQERVSHQSEPGRAALELCVQGIHLAVLAALGLISVAALAGGTYNPFIYFRF